MNKLTTSYEQDFHELLFDDLAYLKQEQATYLELIRTHQLPAHYFLKYKDFKGLTAKKFPEREVATAVAFWIRRMIDGTADEFFAGLKLLWMIIYNSFDLFGRRAMTPMRILVFMALIIINLVKNNSVLLIHTVKR